jgi:sulfate transport system ATP-binding protein
VNTFHGRVDRGLARVDEFLTEAPELALVPEGQAIGYARPHEIEIERQPGGHPAVGARVRRILPIGPLVRVELDRPGRDAIEAELTQERSRALALRVGDFVFVRPRTLRVYVSAPSQQEDSP